MTTTATKKPKQNKCPECGSTHLWAAGTRMTRMSGRVRRLACQNCGKTFNAVPDGKPVPKPKQRVRR